MSEVVRVRLLLAKMREDTEPCVVAAVDETIWEHWNDEQEDAWIESGKRAWGDIYDTEFRQIWAVFAPQPLADAFATPEVDDTLDQIEERP